jgi:hypothetical protein
LWLLVAVWRSSHRSDLATYGAFAVALISAICACIAWVRRLRTSRAALVIAGQDLDRIADLLAAAVQTQWERAASERGLAAGPIPVTLG